MSIAKSSCSQVSRNVFYESPPLTIPFQLAVVQDAQVLGQCREFSPSYPHGLIALVDAFVMVMITTWTTPDVALTSLRMTPRRRLNCNAQLWSPGFESSEEQLFTPPFILIPVYAMSMLHQPGDSKTCQAMLPKS
ncbi:hypothetical protein CPB85DRAFT_1436995 [Mucidula mucida]|nr:hypothetical protein CPB85DRAFT_1436993 [Mucidula mucida]KAF8906354.1 hypothetical protein CPB85DRAFT_1436995 [Mucidula mucida]